MDIREIVNSLGEREILDCTCRLKVKLDIPSRVKCGVGFDQLAITM